VATHSSKKTEGIVFCIMRSLLALPCCVVAFAALVAHLYWPLLLGFRGLAQVDFVALALVLCEVVFLEFFGVVPAGRFRATTLMGKYHRILRPGFYALVPFERLVRMRWTEVVETSDGGGREVARDVVDFPSAADKFDPPPLTVRTQDKADMSLNGVVWWSVAHADFEFFERTADPVSLLFEMYKQAAKNVVGKMTAADVARATYDDVAQGLHENLTKLLEGSGIVIARCGVQGIDYPREIAKKLGEEAKLRQQQEAENLRYRQQQEADVARELNRRRLATEVAATAKSAAEHEAEVLAIQTRARAAKTAADAEAEAQATERRAAAEARATAARAAAEAEGVQKRMEALLGTARKLDPQVDLVELYRTHALEPLWRSPGIRPSVLMMPNIGGRGAGDAVAPSPTGLGDALIVSAMLSKQQQQ